MLRKFLPVLLLAAAVGCSDDEDEAVYIIPANNTSNNATNNSNNASNNASNNGNNASNNASNNANNLEEIPRPDLVTLLDEDIVTLDNGVSSGDLQFEVPENAQSVVITVVGVAPNQYTLRSWINGDGSDLITLGWLASDQGAPSLCLSCPQRIATAEGAFAGMAPTNPAVTLRPGTHTISIYSFKQLGFANRTPVAGPARVIVTAKLAPAVPQEGTLDVNLWFSGAYGLTAETAPTDPGFQKMLEDANGVYAQVGLKLGRITYNDIEGDYDVVENIIAPGSELNELFAQSANAPQEAVNVFFVDDLLTGAEGQQSFGILLGVSGGIPGPVGITGTNKSGVVLALKRSPEAPTPLYKVFAHEVGHFLGLYHTSEASFGFGAQVHDQLTDTPDNDTNMLMHNSGNGQNLSGSQGTTMRLNPWVRQEEM
jgi:hypothetical protein